MPSPDCNPVPAHCSEACFGDRRFAPSQLPELSVQARQPVLFSSSRLDMMSMVTNRSRLVNRHPRIAPRAAAPDETLRQTLTFRFQ